MKFMEQIMPFRGYRKVDTTDGIKAILMYDLMTPTVLTIACLILTYLIKRRQSNAVRTLSHLDDVRSVGQLAGVLEVFCGQSS